MQIRKLISQILVFLLLIVSFNNGFALSLDLDNNHQHQHHSSDCPDCDHAQHASDSIQRCHSDHCDMDTCATMSVSSVYIQTTYPHLFDQKNKLEFLNEKNISLNFQISNPLYRPPIA